MDPSVDPGGLNMATVGNPAESELSSSSSRTVAAERRAVLLRGANPVVRLVRTLRLPLLLLALGTLIPTELHFFSLYTLVGSAIPDVIYLSHGALGLLQGHVPYLPGFMSFPDQRLTYLYPPLTLLITLPPALAGSYYDLGFAIEILVLIGAGSVVLGAWARRLGAVAPIGMLTAVLLLAIGPTLLTRVDGIQGLLVAGSALALIDRRRVLAVALVALAVLVKETAVLAAVPVGLWCLLPDPDDPATLRERLRELAVGVFPALVVFLIFLVWSRGAEVTGALASVHRAMEIESLPASFAILLSHLVPVHPYLGKLASWEIAAPDASVIALVATLLGAALVLGSSLLFAWDRKYPATAIACAVAVGLCATPVLSPQYLLDLLPVLVVAACLEVPSRKGAALVLLGLLAALLTQAEFPYLFASVSRLAPPGLIVLLFRNLVLLLIALALVRLVPLRAALLRLRHTWRGGGLLGWLATGPRAGRLPRGG